MMDARAFRAEMKSLVDGVTFKARIVKAKVGYRWNESKYHDSIVLVVGAVEKGGYRSQKFIVEINGKRLHMWKGYIKMVSDSTPLEIKKKADRLPIVPLDYFGNTIKENDLIYYTVIGRHTYSAVGRVQAISHAQIEVLRLDGDYGIGDVVNLMAFQRIMVVSNVAKAGLIEAANEDKAMEIRDARIALLETEKIEREAARVAQDKTARKKARNAVAKETKKQAAINTLTVEQKEALGL